MVSENWILVVIGPVGWTADFKPNWGHLMNQKLSFCGSMGYLFFQLFITHGSEWMALDLLQVFQVLGAAEASGAVESLSSTVAMAGLQQWRRFFLTKGAKEAIFGESQAMEWMISSLADQECLCGVAALLLKPLTSLSKKKLLNLEALPFYPSPLRLRGGGAKWQSSVGLSCAAAHSGALQEVSSCHGTCWESSHWLWPRGLGLGEGSAEWALLFFLHQRKTWAKRPAASFTLYIYMYIFTNFSIRFFHPIPIGSSNCKARYIRVESERRATLVRCSCASTVLVALRVQRGAAPWGELQGTDISKSFRMDHDSLVHVCNILQCLYFAR